MGTDDAIAWVNAHRGMIISKARRLENFTPYERADYLQDAYEAAILATSVAQEKQLAFEACFWTLFRRQIAIITPNPLSPRHSGCTSPVTTHCREVDTVSERLSAPHQEKSPHDVERLYLAVREHLSEIERKVWVLALGVTRKGRLNNYEIAKELGCSVPNVRQAISRVVTRVARMVEEGRLEISPADIESRHLSVINGLAKKARAEKAREPRPSEPRLKPRRNQAMNQMGERLRIVRGARTLEEFAKLFSIHKNTLANYEKGGRSPDAQFLMALCRAEDVDPGWLLGKADGRPSYRRELLEKTANTLSGMLPPSLGGRSGKLLVNLYERVEALGEEAQEEQIREIAQGLLELLKPAPAAGSHKLADGQGGTQWRTG